MAMKFNELLEHPEGYGSTRRSPHGLDSHNSEWNTEGVFRNLQQDESGTFGVYAGAKLRSAYQPIVSVPHRRVVGYEALLRPFQDDGSRADPAQFLARSVARGEQLMVDHVSRAAHVANYVGAQQNGWLFLNMHPDVFNIGARRGNFARELLDRCGVPAEQVVLELLEHRCYDETSFQEAAQHYRDHGFLLAIDDFGSGHSNFDRVSNLRPDFVKLDRSLVERADDSVVSQRMVRHMVALLHQAGSMVIAEGVETCRQALVMMEADVDFLQGYWLGRPQAVIDAAGAESAVARLQEAWAGFDDFDQTLARQWQLTLQPYRNALTRASQVFLPAEDAHHVAQLFFGCPGSLRFFVLDGHGVQSKPSIVNTARKRKSNPSLKPLHPDVGSNWSRREYFKKAVREVGKVVIVGPHYSLSDGQGCYTAALALRSLHGLVVLCGDFEVSGERTSEAGFAIGGAPTLRWDSKRFDAGREVKNLPPGAPARPTR